MSFKNIILGTTQFSAQWRPHPLMTQPEIVRHFTLPFLLFLFLFFAVVNNVMITLEEKSLTLLLIFLGMDSQGQNC